MQLSDADPKQAVSARLVRLKGLMTSLQPGVIAFSGGVDSRLLAGLAEAWGLDYVLVTVAGQHMSPRELLFARIMQGSLRLPSRILAMDPLKVPEVAGNTRERCYHCKHHLFSGLLALSEASGRPRLLEGSQASDLTSYRPGRRAVEELGVHSPLQAVGMTKDEVRSILAAQGMPWPGQPSRPCLLTRFAYGVRPQSGLLLSLGEAEDALVALGLRDFRIRVLAPDSFVLQIQQSEQDSYRQCSGLAQAVLDQAGFGSAETVFTDRVSGFYDAREGSGQG